MSTQAADSRARSSRRVAYQLPGGAAFDRAPREDDRRHKDTERRHVRDEHHQEAHALGRLVLDEEVVLRMIQDRERQTNRDSVRATHVSERDRRNSSRINTLTQYLWNERDTYTDRNQDAQKNAVPRHGLECTIQLSHGEYDDDEREMQQRQRCVRYVVWLLAPSPSLPSATAGVRVAPARAGPHQERRHPIRLLEYPPSASICLFHRPRPPGEADRKSTRLNSSH